MKPIEASPDRQSSAPRAHDERPLYEPPRITFHEPLEGVASVCGPPNGKGAFPCTVLSS